MKIIDLLNKIANDEEVPNKIKFRDKIYKWINRNGSVWNYKQEYNGRLIDNYLCDDWFMDSESILNDEVEILEEEKKIPEKIKDKYCSQISKVELAQKYNEIIDYLKSKGDE